MNQEQFFQEDCFTKQSAAQIIKSLAEMMRDSIKEKNGVVVKEITIEYESGTVHNISVIGKK